MQGKSVQSESFLELEPSCTASEETRWTALHWQVSHTTCPTVSCVSYSDRTPRCPPLLPARNRRLRLQWVQGRRATEYQKPFELNLIRGISLSAKTCRWWGHNMDPAWPVRVHSTGRWWWCFGSSSVYFSELWSYQSCTSPLGCDSW